MWAQVGDPSDGQTLFSQRWDIRRYTAFSMGMIPLSLLSLAILYIAINCHWTGLASCCARLHSMQFYSMNLSLREILVTDTWFFHSEAAIIVFLLKVFLPPLPTASLQGSKPGLNTILLCGDISSPKTAPTVKTRVWKLSWTLKEH